VNAAPWMPLYLGGLPLVGEDACKQASLPRCKAGYNDIVCGLKQLEEPIAHAKRQHALHVFLCNTKQDGPVCGIAPAVSGASFYGTIEEMRGMCARGHWLRGQGGKYLVLPPDYKGACRTAHIPVVPRLITP